MRTMLVVSAVLLTEFAPVPFPRADRPSNGHPGLAGSWVVETIRVNGTDVSGHSQSGGLEFWVADVVEIERGIVRISHGNSARNSALWELCVQSEGNDLDLVPMVKGQKSTLGIYRLQRRILLLSFRSPGWGRPRAFSEREAVIVLRRKSD